MVTINRINNYISIPSEFILDSELTLEEKGALVCLYYSTNYNINDNLLQSLIDKGYLRVNKSNLTLLDKPLKTVKKLVLDSVEPKKEKKKLSLFDKCSILIQNFTQDKALREALYDYLGLRLTPAGTRLEGYTFTKYTFEKQLNQLSTCKGNKVDIVKNATINHWATFVDTKIKAFDNTTADW